MPFIMLSDWFFYAVYIQRDSAGRDQFIQSAPLPIPSILIVIPLPPHPDPWPRRNLSADEV